MEDKYKREYSIDDIKYINNYEFVIISMKDNLLFDIRNYNRPVSESPLNINFKGCAIKPVKTYGNFNNFNIKYYLILIIIM